MAGPYENKILLESHRDSLPAVAPDQTYQYAPAKSAYGEQGVIPVLGNKLQALADEGSYYIARNATPGTGIAGHAAPTGVPVVGTNDTKPFIVIRNGNSVLSRKRVYLDYIRLSVTAAGTGGTNLNYVVMVDSSPTSRFSSGSTTVLAAANVNTDSSNASSANIQAGPYVATAGSTTTGRILGGGLVRPVINVVGDQYLFQFGAPQTTVGGLITSGTGVALCQHVHGPVALGPQATLLFYLWSASQSAASSHEIEIGYYER